MIWFVLFLAMFSFLVAVAGLAILGFPTTTRRFFVWLADMTPGQVRFLGLAVSVIGLALMLVDILLLMFADFGDD